MGQHAEWIQDITVGALYCLLDMDSQDVSHQALTGSHAFSSIPTRRAPWIPSVDLNIIPHQTGHVLSLVTPYQDSSAKRWIDEHPCDKNLLPCGWTDLPRPVSDSHGEISLLRVILVCPTIVCLMILHSSDHIFFFPRSSLYSSLNVQD